MLWGAPPPSPADRAGGRQSRHPALSAFKPVRPDSVHGTCASLSAFINEVEGQTGKRVDPNDAVGLIVIAAALMS